MTIQYCSDLHLEFKENAKWLKEHPLVPTGEVMLLAGDIVPFAEMDGQQHFFNFLADSFELTIWVPGNHEYYYADASERSGTFVEEVKSNVLLVNNSTIHHRGVRFICSTLWTEISTANQWYVQQAMTDFRLISYQGKPFYAEHYNQLQKANKTFLTQELAKGQEMPTIVITHHIPTFANYPSKYKGDVLNEAFAVELHDLIETLGPDCWIYGHHHCPVDEFAIGKTRLINNQLGYVQYQEHRGFNAQKVFEI